MRAHTGEQRFSWEWGKIPADEKPHTCGQCHEPFAEKDDLEGHMEVHTGEESFCHDQCTKSLAGNGGREKQAEVHAGERTR